MEMSILPAAEIKFSQAEWQQASDLAVELLEALGPQEQYGCQRCNPPRTLLPNYKMKYALAKALRERFVDLETYNMDMYGKHPVDEVSE
jgi:hypothetical protein